MVGDIFEFESGMKIPADCLILEASGEIECNEGDITGLFTMQTKNDIPIDELYKSD